MCTRDCEVNASDNVCSGERWCFVRWEEQALKKGQKYRVLGKEPEKGRQWWWPVPGFLFAMNFKRICKGRLHRIQDTCSGFWKLYIEFTTQKRGMYTFLYLKWQVNWLCALCKSKKGLRPIGLSCACARRFSLKPFLCKGKAQKVILLYPKEKNSWDSRKLWDGGYSSSGMSLAIKSFIQ